MSLHDGGTFVLVRTADADLSLLNHLMWPREMRLQLGTSRKRETSAYPPTSTVGRRHLRSVFCTTQAESAPFTTYAERYCKIENSGIRNRL